MQSLCSLEKSDHLQQHMQVKVLPGRARYAAVDSGLCVSTAISLTAHFFFISLRTAYAAPAEASLRSCIMYVESCLS